MASHILTEKFLSELYAQFSRSTSVWNVVGILSLVLTMLCLFISKGLKGSKGQPVSRFGFIWFLKEHLIFTIRGFYFAILTLRKTYHVCKSFINWADFSLQDRRLVYLLILSDIAFHNSWFLFRHFDIKTYHVCKTFINSQLLYGCT